MSTNIGNIDFGARVIQQVKVSRCVVIPAPLVVALKLKVGERLSFALTPEGIIEIQPEVRTNDQPD